MKPLWIIYDTCTRPQYVQDLFNILALPAGAIIRYTYRSEYLTPAAIDRSETGIGASEDVILFYSQYRNFQKGNNHKDFNENTEKVWVPTRIAKIIDSNENGGKYYYDLLLGHFPDPENKHLSEFVNNHDNEGHAPFNYWVDFITVNNINNYTVVTNSNLNWSNIIDFLHNNTQFVDDSFWRIKSIQNKYGKAIPIKPHSTPVVFPANDHIISYTLSDNRPYYLEIENREPRNNHHREIVFENISDRIGLFQENKVLRPYDCSTIGFSTNLKMDLSRESIVLNLDTKPYQEDNWPVGPKISISLLLVKNPKIVFASIVLLVAGLLVGAIGLQLRTIEDKGLWAILTGICFTLLAGLLFFKTPKTRI